ncbi:hypothetical protein FGIG_11016 [Fasciola gigantica]|uniref:Uncharacterized protein n=1 Tax=Fasciola gigantica TaxID=46835 RepID=A0A504YAQ4_FASGI|nr:hypothetical protein FGIG_11016 [Fasciola gigantica]
MDSTVLEEDGTLSHEEEAFYSEIRGLVVVFLFFVILFTVAHLTLQYFAARPDPDVKQDRADRVVHQLVFGICTFTLTISLTGFTLLPFSIAANEVLLGFPQSYYVQWIDTDLVKDLSLIVNLGTKISCLLLPLSYFLLIAQGFSASPHAFSSRFVEAVCLLMFAYLFVFGIVWSVVSSVASLHSSIVGTSSASETVAMSGSSTVPTELPTTSRIPSLIPVSSSTIHTNSTSFFVIQQPVAILMHSIRTLSWYDFWSKFVLHTVIRMLESVQLVASLFGLVLFFACTPIGLVSIGFYLISASIQALPNLTTPRSALMDHLNELHFDVLCLEDDLRSAELLGSTALDSRSHCTHWYDRLSFMAQQRQKTQTIWLVNDLNQVTGQMVPAIHAQLPRLRQEIAQLRRRVSRSLSLVVREWSRPLIPCLVFGLIFLLLQLMQSYVLFNIAELAWNLLFGSDPVSQSRSGGGAPIAPTTDTTTTTGMSKLVASNLFIDSEHPRIMAMNSRSSAPSFTLGHKPVSVFGHVGAVLQICVIHFLLFISVWGFYATPTGSHLRPRAHSMSLESVMANVVLLLLFSSALPLQSNLLGLTTVTLPSALKTKETVSLTTPVELPDPVPAHEPESTVTEAFWWIWPLRSLLQTSSVSTDERVTVRCGKQRSLDSHKFDIVSRASPTKPSSSVDPQPLLSQFLHIFIPISVHTTSIWHGDETVDSSSSSIPPNNGLGEISNTISPTPIISVHEERSLWTQFISRAFGVSSPTSPASCGLIVVILLYNLCFLATSVWIAGRHLSGPTWSFSLELVTSFRCVQQLQWAGTRDDTRILRKENYDQRSTLAVSPSTCSSPLSCIVIDEERTSRVT